MKRLTVIALSLLTFAVGRSQETLHSWDVSLNVGYMMPNNSSYKSFATSTFGVDATWWCRGIDTSYWRYRKHYPFFGLKFSYAYIPNSIAGNRLGLTGQIRQQLFGLTHWEWSAGVGLSAYTKPRSLTGET